MVEDAALAETSLSLCSAQIGICCERFQKGVLRSRQHGRASLRLVAGECDFML